MRRIADIHFKGIAFVNHFIADRSLIEIKCMVILRPIYMLDQIKEDYSDKQLFVFIPN